MTTFAQHPNNDAPGIPQYAVQEPNTQQYMPAQHTHQQMRSHQHSAPGVQPYPIQDQQFQQSGYAQQPEQVLTQNQRPIYSAVSSYGPTTSGLGYGQQLRPALDQRHSESSFSSARSHKSAHSSDSHRSHHSTKSSHSHRSHHSHRGTSGESKSRRKDRDVDARPTMGDSVMLVVNHFRDLLSGDRR